MTSVSSDQLRALVREVVREAVAASATSPIPAATPVAHTPEPLPRGPLAADERSRTDAVRIASDRDLDVFVRKLLALCENPKSRSDIKAGRLRFALTAAARPGAPAATAKRIERGAVTEQVITEVAAAGGALILGKRAVLTPLAREKARALGVSIKKERT